MILKLQYILIVALSLMCLQAAAQSVEQTLRVDEFDALYVKGSCEIELRFQPDSVGYMLLRTSAEASDVVKTAQASGSLYISAKPSNAAELGRIVVYASEQLGTLALSERCRVAVDAPMAVGGDLSLMTSGNSKIAISTLTAENVNISVSGSGSISLSDTARVGHLNCSVTGSGKINVAKVDARELSATLRGSGKITVGGRAAESSSVAVKGRGSIDVSQLEVAALKAAVYGDGGVSYSPTTKCKSIGNQENIVKK